MIQFFKDSVRELRHVVWPTREETKNYFLIVVITLTLFGIYLFLFSSLFTNVLFGLRDYVQKNEVSSSKTVETPKVDASPSVKVSPSTVTGASK